MDLNWFPSISKCLLHPDFKIQKIPPPPHTHHIKVPGSKERLKSSALNRLFSRRLDLAWMTKMPLKINGGERMHFSNCAIQQFIINCVLLICRNGIWARRTFKLCTFFCTDTENSLVYLHKSFSLVEVLLSQLLARGVLFFNQWLLLDRLSRVC